MIVAGLEARARALPDGAEICAALTACASSTGVAACDAPCLAACDAPRLAACAAFATINAAATQRSGTAMPERSTARPGISIPMIQAPGSGSRAGATRDALDAAQQHENEDDDELPRFRQKG